ncbi:M20/M25/M40 family metallo-hydrolase [Cytobacillus suaedae]|nr:M20/M25/M40 family metallo-hydrolase [Cytobacillus suaedae]
MMMVEKVLNNLVSLETVKKALDFLKEDNDNTTKDQIDITSIPSPTFQEEVRGDKFVSRFKELGLENVHVDDIGNVIGTKAGTGKGPKLVVSAHLDTVFPEGTDVMPKVRDGKIYAPGISDDGRGLAVLLTLLRALNHSKIKTIGDLIFVATVGEEGLGDLRGVKALFQERDDIDGFISIEPGEPNRTVFLGTGSRRYKVTYKGPGGHSFGNFGTPSAIHALGRAIAKIADIETPIQPRTTFNIGTIDGGTSVNTIAAQASMLIDIRSTSQEELTKLEQQILSVIQSAVSDENQRWNKDSISVDYELVGDRPAGSQSAESVIVQTSLAADVALGFKPELCEASSTDSNVPISLGIPAVTLGGGGDFGGVHTLEEYFDPKDAFFGPQKILLTALGLVGIEDETEPLLNA